MKNSVLALLIGSTAARRQLPALQGYSIGEGSYCRREVDEKAGRVEEVCRGCSAKQCADECDADSTCAGFDFHERGLRICWLHYDYEQKFMTEGCKWCDCYLKNGFEGEEEMPPQAPARPDEIDGFRFEQGKCMSSLGGEYMTSRWEYYGDYFSDGIDYESCAEKCRERSDCAGFDVWYENNDCQIFFDSTHYGDGTAEEECFVKVGFQSQDPPQKPERPDQIDGFRFEQGKCMPSNGGGYMSSRWEVPGNYFQDGINYTDCADLCNDREDCAGFDVWEQNNDCQLFFDQDHFGDGTKEEECFIKIDFVPEVDRYSEENFGNLFAQYDFNSDGVFDLDEFRYAWYNEAHEMEFDEPSEEKVITNFQFADANGDGLLDLEEGMTLRPPVIGSHYVDGFMYFDANQDRMMDLDEFSAAYKALDEYVQDGLIATAFKLGDLNGDGNLSWDEFYRLGLIKDGQSQIPEGENMYDHIEYKGFQKTNGYCKKEGQTDLDPNDYTISYFQDLDKCAEGCRQNGKCSAFVFYHESLMCYYYSPKTTPSDNDWNPRLGACFTKLPEKEANSSKGTRRGIFVSLLPGWP